MKPSIKKVKYLSLTECYLEVERLRARPNLNGSDYRRLIRLNARLVAEV